MRMDPPRGPDAATLMVRAIRAHALAAGLAVAIRSIGSRPWESATFAGLRHRVVLDAPPSAALAAWTGSLPEAEWSLRGHLVADLVVDSVGVSDGLACVTLAVLTIVAD